jgi:hypothetical protein
MIVGETCRMNYPMMARRKSSPFVVSVSDASWKKLNEFQRRQRNPQELAMLHYVSGIVAPQPLVSRTDFELASDV